MMAGQALEENSVVNHVTDGMRLSGPVRQGTSKDPEDASSKAHSIRNDRDKKRN